MYWILFYDVASDVASDVETDWAERCKPFRDEHRSLAESSQRMGFLVMAGNFDDRTGGLALIFRCDDEAIVEQFVRDDPYVRAGLVTSWSIRRWNVEVGPDTVRGFGQSRSGIWER